MQFDNTNGNKMDSLLLVYQRHLILKEPNIMKKQKTIVKINRNLLSLHGIKEYIVKDWLKKYPGDIAVPEDDEVILVYEKGGNFPTEIIEEIIKI